ncbi:hypothetical protein ACSZOL_22150, partial [Aeromonas hydrophila]
QPEASSPGAKDENTGAGLCRSRLVVQERLGHYSFLYISYLCGEAIAVIPALTGGELAQFVPGQNDLNRIAVQARLLTVIDMPQK